jgi:hypothetical protein
MRKQDRILRDQEHNRSEQGGDPKGQPPQRPEREQMRGSDSADQAPKPERRPGALPLPE